MKSSVVMLVLISAAGFAQSPAARVPKTTVCEVLASPLKYNGRVIELSGRLNGTDEGAWLIGDDCPGIYVTKEHHVWPSTIFLATPSSTTLGRTRLHAVDFEFDTASEQRLNEKYRRIREVVPDRCISWTYTGLFETRTDWPQAKVLYSNGTSRIIGFGHLGQAPAQLILESANDVAVIPDCERAPSGKTK